MRLPRFNGHPQWGYHAPGGTVWYAALVGGGDRLGLYRALAEGGPQNSAEPAEATGTQERYVREWLRAQAAGGYIDYDAPSDRYHMSPEQVAVLVNEDSPAFLVGAFQGAVAGIKAAPKVEQAFRAGGGVGWHEHDHDLFHGTERLFRPGYLENLAANWIPALDGVADKLERGARVADIGCGYGASTLIMAEAWPNSEFIGFDYHAESVEARAAGRPRPAWATTSASSRRGRRTSGASTTSSPPSTACTTWATRRAWPATSTAGCGATEAG